MGGIKPGDVVLELLFLPKLEKKGIALGYTDDGRFVDILVKNDRHGYFQVNGLPEKELLPTGEHVDISNIVGWFK